MYRPQLLTPVSGGSCVFQPRPFYGAICAGSYSEYVSTHYTSDLLRYTYVNSDNVGCIVYDLDKADCLAADRDPRASMRCAVVRMPTLTACLQSGSRWHGLVRSAKAGAAA